MFSFQWPWMAVLLVARDPPQGDTVNLAHAGFKHPVDGWYPISRWTTGEYVTDHYLIDVPPASRPAAVRVALYRLRADGAIEESAWLSIPLP